MFNLKDFKYFLKTLIKFNSKIIIKILAKSTFTNFLLKLIILNLNLKIKFS